MRKQRMVKKSFLMLGLFMSVLFMNSAITQGAAFTSTFETGDDGWALSGAARSDANNHTDGGSWSMGFTNGTSMTRDVAGGVNESGTLDVHFTTEAIGTYQAFRIQVGNAGGNTLELRNLAWYNSHLWYLVGWNASTWSEIYYGSLVLQPGWNKVSFDVTSETGWSVTLNDGANGAPFLSQGEAQNYFADGISNVYIGDVWGSTGFTHTNYIDDVNWVVPEPATMFLLSVGGLTALIRRKR